MTTKEKTLIRGYELIQQLLNNEYITTVDFEKMLKLYIKHIYDAGYISGYNDCEIDMKNKESK